MQIPHPPKHRGTGDIQTGGLWYNDGWQPQPLATTVGTFLTGKAREVSREVLQRGHWTDTERGRGRGQGLSSLSSFGPIGSNRRGLASSWLLGRTPPFSKEEKFG